MIYVIMPAFNEEEGLEKLLHRIKVVMEYEKYEYKILVVNDGSIDRTEYVLKSHLDVVPLEYVNMEQNSGITKVFQVAFEKVLGEAKDDDIIISLDSDNTQNPYAMIDLIKSINEGYGLSIASRFVEGSRVVGVPAFRMFLSNGVAFLLGALFPFKGVKDYSTFYRAYRVDIVKKALEKMPIDQLIVGHGFSSMASFLLKILYISKPEVKEVPINLRYDLKEGGTGMRIFKTIMGYLKLIKELQEIKRKYESVEAHVVSS